MIQRSLDIAVPASTAREAHATPSQHSGDEAFAQDVRRGLSLPRKQLPCKYFYDERGATLFDEICDVPEYYPTRTEMQILGRYGADIAAAIGPEARLIEPGSGAAIKVRILLDHLADAATYVPVDISREQLESVAQTLSADYPRLEVAPVCADFTDTFELPRLKRAARRTVVYFPGSTIGNFEPEDVAAFLERVRAIAGTGGALLIGVDLKKDPAILHAAYNDAAGVTAAFNLNLLHRINRELGGTFDVNRFAHYAFYNPLPGRIEMHLLSRTPQVVHVAGRRFEFAAGESIHTESSYKYAPNQFAQLAAAYGFKLRQVWTDEQRWFSVQMLDVGE